jgi:hypothetical protein
MKKAIITKDIRKQDKVDVGVALDGHPVGTAVGDSDGEQLRHCDVGIMLRALVSNALEVDVGVALGALSVTRRRAGSETRWSRFRFFRDSIQKKSTS